MGKTFLNAILSGIAIGLAATVYIAVPDPLAGATLFAFGLTAILCYGFKLYTGAVGYLMNQGRNTPVYLLTLLVIWVGNLAGTFLVGTMIRASRTYSDTFAKRVAGMCEAKLSDSWSSILILAFFCGVLMYLAVETYRRKEELAPIFRFAMVVFCVVVFILSGFEHCIANMYYFSVADVWSAHTVHWLLIMTLGNSLGGFLIPVADKFRLE